MFKPLLPQKLPEKLPETVDTPIIYNGSIVTPEYLGNFTYGIIGAAIGLNYETLIFGSELAAGFPGKRDVFSTLYKTIHGINLSDYEEMLLSANEFDDHPAIYAGYQAYQNSWKNKDNNK